MATGCRPQLGRALQVCWVDLNEDMLRQQLALSCFCHVRLSIWHVSGLGVPERRLCRQRGGSHCQHGLSPPVLMRGIRANNSQPIT